MERIGYPMVSHSAFKKMYLLGGNGFLSRYDLFNTP